MQLAGRQIKSAVISTHRSPFFPHIVLAVICGIYFSFHLNSLLGTLASTISLFHEYFNQFVGGPYGLPFTSTIRYVNISPSVGQHIRVFVSLFSFISGIRVRGRRQVAKYYGRPALLWRPFIPGTAPSDGAPWLHWISL